MFTLILIITTVISIKGSAIPDNGFKSETMGFGQEMDMPPIVEQKEVNLISYIENFKNIISNYVNEQYQLTKQHLQKVHEVVEDFLKKLAVDLKDVMDNNGKDWELKHMDDGLPDEKFEEVKKKVVEEFSDIEDKTADELVYRLRKNLYETKQRLDEVVEDSTKVIKE